MSPREPASRSKAHPLLGFLVMFLAVALILGGAELGLRIFTDVNSQWNLRVGAGKVFDPVVQFRNKPNYRFWNGATTNEHGYFAPPNLRHENPDDRLRIIFMGDSVTYMPTTNNHPVQLERLLSARGYAVETVNTAVPGFASYNVRAMFESEVSKYDADIFILNVGWNDLGRFGPESSEYLHEASYEVSAVERVIANIYLVRAIYALQRVVRHNTPAFDEELNEADEKLYSDYYPDHYHENVKAILSLAKKRYPLVYVANLATVTSENPDPFQLKTAHFPTGMDKNMRKLHRVVLVYNEIIEKIASELDVPVIDLYSSFQNDEARSNMTDSCHVNRHGAAQIGATVLASIEAKLPPVERYPRHADHAGVQSADSGSASGQDSAL